METTSLNVEFWHKKHGWYMVRLAGRLAPGWAGGFAQSLARHGFNIERGLVRRDARGHCVAEFEFSGAPAGVEPATLDYASFASSAASGSQATGLRLDDYSLVGPSGDGTVALTLEAPDQAWFLGGLLERLAYFSLFPTEMWIETTGGMVKDRVHLRSIGGGPPSDDVLGMLRRWLDTRLLKTRAG
jgi:hypothetical protein